MIKMKVDYSGVMKTYNELYNKFTSINGSLAKVVQVTSAYVWVPNIKARLGIPTGTSGYEAELDQTMNQLDPVFVQRLGGQSLNGMYSSAWADRIEAERRVPGGYQKGEIIKKINQVIKASNPIKVPDGIYVGIGELDILNSLFSGLGVEQQFKLWQILNYGTGTESGGSPVVRTGKQIFFGRNLSPPQGVLTWLTTNPGFKGREFFVKMDGSMHESDYVVRSNILRYMKSVIRNLSYGKK